MISLQFTRPKARKDHVCNFCHGIIPRGEKYERQANIYDNKVYTWKAHFRCLEITSKLKMFDYCDEGVTQDDFYETINETYANINKELTENPEFEYPKFPGRLDSVCEHYLTD